MREMAMGIVLAIAGATQVNAATKLVELPASPMEDAAFAPHAGGVVFEARDATHGAELWWTDGSPEGTLQLTELGPGNADGLCGADFNMPPLFVVDEAVYFFGYSEGAVDLWRVRLGEAPTRVRALGLPCAGTFPYQFSAALREETRDLFVIAPAQRTPEASAEAAVWRVSLPSGEASVAAFPDAGYQITRVDSVWNGSAFVRLNFGSNQSGRFARIDDTTVPGTVAIVVDSLYGAHAVGTYLGDQLLGGAYLYRSNGTAAGTTPLTSTGIVSARPGVEWNGVYYLPAALYGTDWDLWRTDGTLEGTRIVRDFHAGYAGLAGNVVMFDDRLVFFRANYGGQIPSTLHVSDGTETGTIEYPFADPSRVLTRRTFNGPSTTDMVVVGEDLYLVAVPPGSATWQALWRVNAGSDEAHQASETLVAPGRITRLAYVNGQVLLRYAYAGEVRLFSTAPSLFLDGFEP
jgi:ELWxxDGT repeat protein